MKKALLLAAGLALAAATGALALEGEYASADGATTLNFAADGSYTVVTQGITIPGTYKVEGDTVTIAHPADSDTFCMGAEGVYTVAETDAGATFTTVNDPCEARATAMAVAWTKKAAE